MNRKDMRSPLARAIGLGSAKSGVEHWWAERLSAIALIPLTLWFIASIVAHTGSDYAAFSEWVRRPYVPILMIALLITLFYHAALGLQVIIEDYQHSWAKLVSIIATQFGCFILAIAGTVATLMVALGPDKALQ